VNVIDEPLTVYSAPDASSTPLRYKRRLLTGFGADANVNVRFVPLTTPPGVSLSVKFVAAPEPVMR
jgi:hypothetical protein